MTKFTEDSMARLDIVAVEVSNSNHGDFLKSLAKAWQLADPFNKRILMYVWIEIVVKYRLYAEYADKINEHMGEYSK